MGPLLGLVAAGVVSVGGALYTAHEYQKLMNGSVLDSTDNMNAFQKALADLTGIQRYSNDELKVKYRINFPSYSKRQNVLSDKLRHKNNLPLLAIVT